MASQFYHQWLDYFRIDVHGCSLDGAFEIVNRRIDDCYAYGIPFLEVVHGGSNKAKREKRRSIGEELREKLVSPLVQTKIPLDNKGYDFLDDYYCNERIDGYDASDLTALRLCLKANPSPTPRSEDVIFRGFTPLYTYKPQDVFLPPPCWQLGTNDVRPFAVIPTYWEELCDTLVGGPLAPPDSDERSGIVYWEDQETIEGTLREVLDQDDLDIVGHDEPWLRISYAQFQTLRSRLVGNFITQSQMAELLGCPRKWIKWCDHKYTEQRFCAEWPASKSPLFVNFLDKNGRCVEEWCYQSGSEEKFAELWNLYGVNRSDGFWPTQ